MTNSGMYTFIEVKEGENWVYNSNNNKEIFNIRSYHIFSFLDDIRGYYYKDSTYSPLENLSDLVKEYYIYSTQLISYFTLEELINFDYDNNETYSLFSNRKVIYREFLGEAFFVDLELLKTLGEPKNVRIIFLFNT